MNADRHRFDAKLITTESQFRSTSYPGGETTKRSIPAFQMHQQCIATLRQRRFVEMALMSKQLRITMGGLSQMVKKCL